MEVHFVGGCKSRCWKRTGQAAIITVTAQARWYVVTSRRYPKQAALEPAVWEGATGANHYRSTCKTAPGCFSQLPPTPSVNYIISIATFIYQRHQFQVQVRTIEPKSISSPRGVKASGPPLATAPTASRCASSSCFRVRRLAMASVQQKGGQPRLKLAHSTCLSNLPHDAAAIQDAALNPIKALSKEASEPRAHGY